MLPGNLPVDFYGVRILRMKKIASPADLIPTHLAHGAPRHVWPVWTAAAINMEVKRVPFQRPFSGAFRFQCVSGVSLCSCIMHLSVLNLHLFDINVIVYISLIVLSSMIYSNDYFIRHTVTSKVINRFSDTWCFFYSNDGLFKLYPKCFLSFSAVVWFHTGFLLEKNSKREVFITHRWWCKVKIFVVSDLYSVPGGLESWTAFFWCILTLGTGLWNVCILLSSSVRGKAIRLCWNECCRQYSLQQATRHIIVTPLFSYCL